MKYCVVGTGADRDPDDPHHFLGNAGNALYLFEADGEGTLSQLDGPVSSGINPMFAVFHSVGDNLLVYSVDMDDDTPSVRAFAVDAVSKKLSEVSKVGSLGAAPCHLTIATSDEKTYLFVANYMGGNAAAIPVEADGKLGKATDSVDLTQFFKPQPHGRQEKSHPHGVSFATKHSSLYVCDLGCNVVARFKFDFKQGKFADGGAGEACTLAENAGPRHIAFGPDAMQGYVINELDNTITILDIAADTGSMSIKKVVSTLPEGYDGPKPFEFYDAPSHSAEVMVSGDRLYATNRGHDSIASFDLDGQLLGFTKSGGRLPWTLVEDGGLFVANNQFNNALRDPGNISVFKMAAGGSKDQLELCGSVTLSKPMCTQHYPTGADICTFETVDDRAEALGLPPAPKAAGTYKPALINSGSIHLAGHGPLLDDGTYITGKVDMAGNVDGSADATTGYQAGRQCALASLATLKATLGTLSKVKQLVRTLGMVNAGPDFTDHVAVVNGFSDVMKEVFGEEVGIGVRSAVGMASLPFNIPVEVETTWELKDQDAKK